MPRFIATSLVLALVLVARAAEPDAKVPPIKEITVSPKPDMVGGGSPRDPVVLRSAKDAAACFTEEELAKLTKAVDFNQQIVLVFKWQGSGGDRLSYTVAESNPEQVTFHFQRGLTKDLRRHLVLYALRSKFKWTFAQGR